LVEEGSSVAFGTIGRIGWLALGLALAGCAGHGPVDGHGAYDQAGNRYPAACMTDLSAMVTDGTARVEQRPQAEIQRRGDALRIFGSARAIAMIEPIMEAGDGGRFLILIDETVTGWRYDDALRHELCHIVAGPRWHGVP